MNNSTDIYRRCAQKLNYHVSSDGEWVHGLISGTFKHDGASFDNESVQEILMLKVMRKTGAGFVQSFGGVSWLVYFPWNNPEFPVPVSSFNELPRAICEEFNLHGERKAWQP